MKISCRSMKDKAYYVEDNIMSRNEDLCEIRLGEWRCFTFIRLAARHDLDCYLEGVESDSSCSDSLIHT